MVRFVFDDFSSSETTLTVGRGQALQASAEAQLSDHACCVQAPSSGPPSLSLFTVPGTFMCTRYEDGCGSGNGACFQETFPS